jgi:hypothetical protein
LPIDFCLPQIVDDTVKRIVIKKGDGNRQSAIGNWQLKDELENILGVVLA